MSFDQAKCDYNQPGYTQPSPAPPQYQQRINTQQAR